MNYLLAKKLKDAGFPQVGKDAMNKDLDVFVERSGKLCRSWNTIDAEACRVPTLSELIEACGEGYFDMRKTPQGIWEATSPHKTIRQLVSETGSTPKEAVANLWLALNRK